MYTPPENPIHKTITATIKKVVRIKALYCFGSNAQSYSSSILLHPKEGSNSEHTHLYLLAIADPIPPNAIADMTSIIKDKWFGTITVTVLLHTPLSIKKATGNQQYFFKRVMRKGILLFGDSNNPVVLNHEGKSHRDPHASARYWQARKTIAEELLSAATHTSHPGTEAICEALLHTVVEQISLGLLDVFLGYRPNHHALGYLFDLCETFTPLTSQIFPRHTEEDKLLFSLLNAHPSSLRYRDPTHPNGAYTEILHKRCRNFFEKALELIDLELIRQNKKWCNETVVSN